MTIALVLLAAAILLVPVPRRDTRAARPAASALVPGAVLAVGAASIALAGLTQGVLLAALLCPAAWFGLRRLTRAGPAKATAAGHPAVPLVLDLVAAALRAGRPPAAALAAAAPAAPDPIRTDLERVAGLLRLGADAAGAWASVADGVLAPVAVVAVRSASSGARLAVSFERLAGEWRAEAAAAAGARAQRAGVLAMAPLGACFLPSFVLLGVVPVVVGIAASAFRAVV